MRKIVLLLGAIFILGILGYYQFGRDAEVVSSHRSASGDTCTENLTVVANKLFIYDKEELAEEIVERCINSEFSGIKFSYDRGIPNKIEVVVYCSEKDMKKSSPVFRFTYASLEDNANIFDEKAEYSIIFE